MDEIVNKVASSGLTEINLETFYPKGDRMVIDIRDLLFQGLILREKDLRDHVKNTDWSKYKNAFVAITCSADAVIPTWAYMLLTQALQPHAAKVILGNKETLETILFLEALSKIDPRDYIDKRVVVKGCGAIPVPDSAYVEITRLLTPVVKSLFFGEACSTVPLYKKK